MAFLPFFQEIAKCWRIGNCSSCLSLSVYQAGVYCSSTTSIPVLHNYSSGDTLQVDEGDSSARRMLSRLLVGSLLVQHSPRLVNLLIKRGHVEIISLFTVALSYQVGVVRIAVRL